MTRTLLVAPTGHGVGLTATCLGLVHALAGRRLAGVGLVVQLDVDTNYAMVVTLDPLDLLRDVLPEVVGHLHIPAPDDNVHATSTAVMGARRARLRTAASSARHERHTTGTRAGDGVTPPLPRSSLTVAEPGGLRTPQDCRGPPPRLRSAYPRRVPGTAAHLLYRPS